VGEAQVGQGAQVHAPGQAGAQKALGLVQSVQGLLAPFGSAAHGEGHKGDAHVRVELAAAQAHKLQARVLHFLKEHDGQLLQNLVAHTDGSSGT